MITGKSVALVKSGSMAGRKMARFRLEDLSGRVHVTCFPRTFEEVRDLIEDGNVVVALGKLEEDTDEPAILLNELVSIEQALARFTGGLVVHVTPEDAGVLPRLQAGLKEHPGKQPVYLQVRGTDGQSRRVRAGSTYDVTINGELARQLDEVLGAGRVKLARM
jgi:DNA polymerase-3 subunit alpha